MFVDSAGDSATRRLLEVVILTLVAVSRRDGQYKARCPSPAFEMMQSVNVTGEVVYNSRQERETGLSVNECICARQRTRTGLCKWSVALVIDVEEWSDGLMLFFARSVSRTRSPCSGYSWQLVLKVCMGTSHTHTHTHTHLSLIHI